MHLESRRTVRLLFDGAENGLVSRGSAPRHFQAAGMGGQFHPADATIEGSEIVVSCPQVLEPVAVRSAWSNDPAHCNLYNSEELPATPFRTDRW